MNAIVVGVLSFLVISPAICDEGLSKNANEKESATINPQPYFNSLERDMNDASLWNSYGRQQRAPSGFFGVRGKKDYDDDWSIDNENEILPYLPKRVPSGFVGMRGKKYYDSFKRAPSGFFGVRGKKYDSKYQPSFTDNDLQAELFHELLKEREMLANLMEDANDYDDEREKRRPEGFIGMRGKKSVNNDDYYDYEKRSPLGFTGVRGKKSESTNFIDKRVPVASFFGMRGKKERQPVSGFFGIHKKPYFPYGKFVGVRGKKSPDSSIKSLFLSENDITGLRPASLVGSDTAQNIRIGFVGSRG